MHEHIVGPSNIKVLSNDEFVKSVSTTSNKKNRNRIRSNKIQLMFLSSCFSLKAGMALLRIVDHVIACTGKIEQRVARAFAKVFYRSLFSNGMTIKASFAQASDACDENRMFVLLPDDYTVNHDIFIQPGLSSSPVTDAALTTQGVLNENITNEVPSDIALGKRSAIKGRASEMLYILKSFTNDRDTGTSVVTIFGSRSIGKTELVKHTAQYMFVRSYFGYAVYIPIGEILSKSNFHLKIRYVKHMTSWLSY